MSKISFLIFVVIILIVLLLLTVSAQVLCIWCMTMFIKEFLYVKEKNRKRKWRHEQKEPVLYEELYNSKGKQYYRAESVDCLEGYNYIKKEGEDQIGEEMVSEPNLYKENLVDSTKDRQTQEGMSLFENEVTSPDKKEPIMSFIRWACKDDYIKIDFSQNRRSDPYGVNCEYAEASDGNLVVYQEQDGIYQVVPIDDHIGEKEYNYSAIGSCYEINHEIIPGTYFRILNVEKMCTMNKIGMKYNLLEKGKLKVEKVSW